MYTTVAYSESIDEAGALANLASVTDDHIRTEGDLIRVSALYKFIMGYFLAGGSTGSYGQLQSPSLHRILNPDVSPVHKALSSGDIDSAVHVDPLNPMELLENEGLEFLSNANPASAEIHTGVVFLSDGVQQPVNGEIFTVRATASITGVNSKWAGGQMTLSQTLPVGEYALVGARIESANTVAARFVPIGGQNRPGCIAVADANDRENPKFRKGELGEWLRFNSLTPPSLEILGIDTVTAQVIYLDLIKIS